MSPRASAWLSLAGSLGTLVCCALPLLLVTLGFGVARLAPGSAVSGGSGARAPVR